MIKVRLLQPGQPDVEVVVPGDSAVIGRDAHCDVVVDQRFVSKRHVQILRGVVLVDLSTNGTFVDGRKIGSPHLLSGGLFNLAERLDVAVEVADSAPTSTGMLVSHVDELALVREQLESERARGAVLASDLAELRRREQSGGGESEAKLATLEGENRDLRRRLESLKEHVEGHEVEAAASLQARLADEQLREVQRKNQELAARVRELEGHAPSPPGELRPVPPAQAQEIQRLQAELDRARQAALPPSELFAQLHRENQELRERLQHFESGDASPAVPATELFFQLQAENRELRRQLEELQKARAPAKPSKKERPTGELENLRTALAVSKAELSRLRREPGDSGRVSDSRAGLASVSGGSVLRIARLVVERDVDRIEASEAATAEDFLVLESLAFLRKAERLVTRMAGSMIQILNPHTMLPDVEGNFRSLTARLMNLPDERGPRDELSGYLRKLSEWLVVAIGAPRKATLEFVAELKHELSEDGLTKVRPIPVKIVPGQREAELWRRACEHLKELSPEMIEDRLEKLGRETARGLLGLPEG